MRLKKFYKKDAEGNAVAVDYVQVLHTGTKPEQHFSLNLMDQMMRAGFAMITRDQIVLHTKPKDLIYTVKRHPGYYCCHCKEYLPDAGLMLASGETVGQNHVGIVHSDATSPDPSNPAGYERINYYDVVLNSDLHEEFRLKSKEVANG